VPHPVIESAVVRIDDRTAVRGPLAEIRNVCLTCSIFLRAPRGSGPHSRGPGPPGRATAPNALRDWNSVPVLVEGKDGGFATSGEFLCHV
jgi:hypothetical protein